MQDTIDTMFVNKVIRITSFFHSHHESQDKCILRGQKPVIAPDPLKYPQWRGGRGCQSALILHCTLFLHIFSFSVFLLFLF